MNQLALLPEVSAFLQRQHGHFINGQPVSGEGMPSLKSLTLPQSKLSRK